MSTFGCSSSNINVTLVGALSNDSIDQLMGTPISDRIYQCRAVKQFPQIKVLQGAKGKREMSRQQWEDMKPFIQRIYIDENKPFPYLAHILRTEHGFEPTKRQFSRKVEEWGFRKNVSRSERHEILQSVLSNVDQKVSDIKDRRVGPGKLDNWKRRYRKEASIGGSLSARSANIVSTTDFPLGQPRVRESHLTSSIQNSCPTNIDFEPLNNALCHIDWANVDLPGSPTLSRLLGALEIECSNPIPPLSIDEGDPAKSQYISNTQLCDLWNGANKSLVYSIEGLNSSNEPRLDTPLSLRKREARRSHWQDTASGLCARSPSPFNEVYVFPPQRTSLTFKHHGLDQPVWMALKSRAADLQLKLSKLKPLLGCDHPKILVMTKQLARVYLDKGDVNKAGNLFQSLANAMQTTHGPVNLKSLDVWLDVVDCLQDEGKEMQAQNILDNLYPAILNLAHPGEEAATKALHMMSRIAMRQEDWNRAEELLRQVLRVRLTLSGLKCQGTWKCISNLGKVLAKQHQNAEAERLLLIALQLVSKIPDSNPRYTAKILNALALNYAMKGQLEESEDVCRRAIEALERPLELHSRPLINLYGRLAWIFLDRRRFKESEVLFRTVVNQYSSRKVECHRSALKFTEGLAITLEHLGRIDEAAGLYEKVYFGFAECSRPESEHVMSACYGLGQFYLAHGRRGDSERLYQDHIRKIWETEDLRNDVEEVVARVQNWMSITRPGCLGVRDWYLRYFGKDVEILKDGLVLGRV